MMHRIDRIKRISKVVWILTLLFPVFFYAQVKIDAVKELIFKLDKDRVVKDADEYMKEAPITTTSYKAERSAGGIHDFYSEGDYWWPDP